MAAAMAAEGQAAEGGRGGGERRWIDGGSAYSTVERGEPVRYGAATGERKVLMSAKELTPPKLERALLNPVRPTPIGYCLRPIPEQ